MHPRLLTLRTLEVITRAYHRRAVKLADEANKLGATRAEILECLGYNKGIADIAFQNMLKRMERHGNETSQFGEEKG